MTAGTFSIGAKLGRRRQTATPCVAGLATRWRRRGGGRCRGGGRGGGGRARAYQSRRTICCTTCLRACAAARLRFRAGRIVGAREPAGEAAGGEQGAHGLGARLADVRLPNARPPRLTLLIDAEAGSAWAEAAARLGPDTPLRVVHIASSLQALRRHAAPPTATAGTPPPVCALDPSGGWAAKSKLQPCGALLVRPDGHVAWRCVRLADGEETGEEGAAEVADAARAASLLEDALQRTLHRNCALP